MKNKKTKKYGIIIILFFLFSNITCINANKNTVDEWDVTLEFTDSTDLYDYVVFGEKSDAVNGPPDDKYDMPKPPSPMIPYIRAWFNDNLEAPFNLLLKDYRSLSSELNTWNMTVIWVPDDSSTNTTITISWNKDNVSSIGYTSVKLYEEGESDPVSDMIKDEYYEFEISSNVAQNFKIQCKNEKSDNKTPFLPLSIIITAIILLILSRKKKTF